MYQKPKLERFGTFRELTRLGLSNASDGASILGVVTSPGCYSDFRDYGYGEYSIGCPTTS